MNVAQCSFLHSPETGNAHPEKQGQGNKYCRKQAKFSH